MNSMAKLSLALAAALAATSVGAATEYQYTMLFSGQVGGQHITRIADDGSITTDFSYRDNGRGPDYKEQLALAPDGTLQRRSVRWWTSASNARASGRNGPARWIAER
jgi:hypothetical protein